MSKKSAVTKTRQNLHKKAIESSCNDNNSRGSRFATVKEHDAVQENEKSKSNKVTDEMLTIYEYSALISYRAKRLRVGDPPRVDYKRLIGKFDPIAIAKIEMEHRVIPVLLIRRIPCNGNADGFYEETWDVKHMSIRDC